MSVELVLDESIAQGIQQEAPKRGTPTGRPHADRALDQACRRLPTPNTNTVHSRHATSEDQMRVAAAAVSVFGIVVLDEFFDDLGAEGVVGKLSFEAFFCILGWM